MVFGNTINSRIIDGMPTEFEWRMFPGITTLGSFEKIQKLMTDLQCEPAHSNDWIIFTSICNDIAWGHKGNTERRRYNSQRFTDSCELCSQVPSRRWSFLEPETEKKWYGSHTDKPDGSWDRIAENFSESGHPIFRASSAFEKGELRSKRREARSLLTSTVAMKTSSCFSAR